MKHHQKLNKICVPIQGMHCRSCELLIEDKLQEIKEVKKVAVDHKSGTAEIFYDSEEPKYGDIDQAVREAGYSIGSEAKPPFFSRNVSDYKDLGIAFIFLVGAYFILKGMGLGGLSVNTSADSLTLPVILLVGLTAGFSTCMAMAGGLVLGISSRHAETHPEATALQKFRPHLFFNLGRVTSYFVLGGLLGGLGSIFQLSSFTLGILTIAVGLVMMIMGLQLIEIFPWAQKLKFTLPKALSRLVGAGKHKKEYSHKNSIIMGALTFFLPCGFTQAMQLYAIGTGSFFWGGLIMGTFALGTLPGLLGVGGLTSVIKGVFAKRFFKFAGLVVIFLSLFNISNGMNLTGWNFKPANFFAKAEQAGSDVSLENGVQVIKMAELYNGYKPNNFTIKKNVPVKWVIDAQSPYSCAATIVVPQLNIKQSLKSGENTIEFTPTETGTINFSCSMGMYTGSFNVVDQNSQSNNVNAGQDQAAGNQTQTGNVNASAPIAPAGGCGAGVNQGGGCGAGTAINSGGGCGCGGGGGCGGGKKFTPSPGQVDNSQTGPTGASRPETNNQNEQIINTSYTYSQDIQPNVFTVKAGQPVKFVVDVKENASGCMSTIMVPGLYNTPESLEQGKTIVMQFTPSKTGEYPITCAMGVPRGTIKVE